MVFVTRSAKSSLRCVVMVCVTRSAKRGLQNGQFSPYAHACRRCKKEWVDGEGWIEGGRAARERRGRESGRCGEGGEGSEGEKEGGREGRVGLTTKPPFVRPSSWDAWDASLRKNVIEIAVNDTGGVIYYVQ